tara:strand:+ start:1308 stop:1427 length:120 start_codon:yes stop_codon:yes gene_type:complete
VDSFRYLDRMPSGAIMKEEVVLIIVAMGFLLTLKLMGWL